MQIFYLDENPIYAARMLCDKHTISQPKEATQILSGVLHVIGQPVEGMYKPIMLANPCCVWARQSLDHYQWLWWHGIAGFDEYTNRYNRKHKSEDVFRLLPYWPNLPHNGWHNPPQNFSKKYWQESPVKAYRDYYRAEKAYFAKWDRRNYIPEWWTT